MKTFFLLIFAFLFLSFKISKAETLSGELENPGFDPLFWVSSTSDCAIIETEANNRYQNSSNELLKIELDIVMNEVCGRIARDCNLKWCEGRKLNLAKKENVILAKEEVEESPNGTILNLEMKAKAELGRLLKERKEQWRNNIEQTKKSEELEKLRWQKLVMPFDYEDEIKPIVREVKPNELQQKQALPNKDDSSNAAAAVKKNKYFNILKKD